MTPLQKKMARSSLSFIESVVLGIGKNRFCAGSSPSLSRKYTCSLAFRDGCHLDGQRLFFFPHPNIYPRQTHYLVQAVSARSLITPNFGHQDADLVTFFPAASAAANESDQPRWTFSGKDQFR
jgi:hypothetical protein